MEYKNSSDHVNSDGQLQEAIDGLSQEQIWVVPGGADILPELYGEENKHSRAGFPRTEHREFALVQELLHQEIPTLAICRGHQLINVAAGGTLWQDLGEDLGITFHSHTSVRITDGPLTKIGELIPANTFHHQAVRTVAPNWEIGAVSPDGIIESIFCIGLPVISVQWHPEWLDDNPAQLEWMFAYLENFYKELKNADNM